MTSVPAVDDSAVDVRAGRPAPSPVNEPGPLLTVGRAAVAGVVLVLALLLAPGVEFRYPVHRVESTSMAPTINPGDAVVVDRQAYRGASPERGDIVVFVDPGGWGNATRGKGPPTGDSSARFVKRVIGVGGDRVRCCHPDGEIHIDEQTLREDYRGRDVAASRTRFDVVVPEGTLWVMGDNRDDSLDSRHLAQTPHLGFVPESNVVGRVALALPLGRSAEREPAGRGGPVPAG